MSVEKKKEVILIYTPQDKDLAGKFKWEIFGGNVPIKLREYVVEGREELITNGRNFVERFFNEALGLRVRDSEEAGGGNESMAFTPTWFTQSSPSVDKRSLAECYVYVKTFNIQAFPAVIVDGQVVAEGKIPSIDELMQKLGLPLQKPETGAQPLKVEERGEALEAKSEPIYVQIKPEEQEAKPSPEPQPTAPLQEGETMVVKIKDSGSVEALDDETRSRILEVLNRTRFIGPSECTSCLYFIESDSRCALLHVNIVDPKRPVCRSVAATQS